VTAGTIFHGSRLPLHSWFAAIWYVVNQKAGHQCARASAGAGLRQLPDGVPTTSLREITLRRYGSVSSSSPPVRLRTSTLPRIVWRGLVTASIGEERRHDERYLLRGP
jgi:hypothetical protein